MRFAYSCPNCDGKGHVMDGVNTLGVCLSVILIPLIFFDKNDKDGITRKSCGRCKGKGYIIYDR